MGNLIAQVDLEGREVGEIVQEWLDANPGRLAVLDRLCRVSRRGMPTCARNDGSGPP